MAELRLIAITAALVVGGCRCSSKKSKPKAGAGSAVAGPLTSGLPVPAGWQPLPALASAATQAASPIKVDGAEAWGDTARGCYASWLALHAGGGGTDTMANQLLDSITKEPALAGIAVRDVVKPTSGATGVLSFSFERALYHGKLRATLAESGTIVALACFWNQREPAACDQACTQLIGAMR